MSETSVIPVVFSGKDKYGDFNWMIKQPTYNDAIFLFNENVESFYNGYSKGGMGNAIIRPYRYTSPIKAMPIPTGYINFNDEGWKGGFRRLDKRTKQIIDDAFELIYQLIRDRKIKKVFYSAEPDGRLGTSIFHVNEKVIDYIMLKLANILDLF